MGFIILILLFILTIVLYNKNKCSKNCSECKRCIK